MVTGDVVLFDGVALYASNSDTEIDVIEVAEGFKVTAIDPWFDAIEFEEIVSTIEEAVHLFAVKVNELEMYK